MIVLLTHLPPRPERHRPNLREPAPWPASPVAEKRLLATRRTNRSMNVCVTEKKLRSVSALETSFLPFVRDDVDFLVMKPFIEQPHDHVRLEAEAVIVRVPAITL